MNPQHLGITKSEYINILRNRNIRVSDNISIDNLLKTITYERKILDIEQMPVMFIQRMRCLIMT